MNNLHMRDVKNIGNRRDTQAYRINMIVLIAVVVLSVVSHVYTN